MTDDFLGYVKYDAGYTHSNGQRCWRTDLGKWVRDGEGVGSDAGCPDWHGEDDKDPSVEEWKRTLMDKPLDPKVFHGSDPVNLPPHYRVLPVECIDVTEHFNFCMGNAIKYLWRHQHKGNPIQDLEKAAWYIKREIERLKREQ